MLIKSPAWPVPGSGRPAKGLVHDRRMQPASASRMIAAMVRFEPMGL